MKIIINGSNGRMGKAVARFIEQDGDMTAVAFVDVNNVAASDDPIYEKLSDFTGEADCIIDFSHHTCTEGLLEYAVSRNIPTVICTTAHTDEEKAMIKAASEKIPVFFSANMSLGIAVMNDICKTAAKMFPGANIEIIEKHHNQKLDVPSGTALLLADGIKSVRPTAVYNVGRHENGKRTDEEIGIHSLRMGNVIGEHEVIINTGTQTLSIKHEAHDRSLFAEGAISAAKFLYGKAAGFYDMTDVIKD